VTEPPTNNDETTTERRGFLRALGASGAAGVAATSGCLGVLTGSEPARFTAGVARVPAGTRSDTGFETVRVETGTSEREFSAGGQTRSVVADNTLAEYDRAVEIPNVGRYRAALYATFTTPAVAVLGETFNPVADTTPAEIARRTLARVESLEPPERTGGFSTGRRQSDCSRRTRRSSTVSNCRSTSSSRSRCGSARTSSSVSRGTRRCSRRRTRSRRCWPRRHTTRRRRRNNHPRQSKCPRQREPPRTRSRSQSQSGDRLRDRTVRRTSRRRTPGSSRPSAARRSPLPSVRRPCSVGRVRGRSPPST